MLSPLVILSIVVGYFTLLCLISRWTSQQADNQTFFTGNRDSKWYLVAFGMIGTSLSGVTFISVPGWVATSQFSYMQMVLGYLLGYAVIAFILLPLYYRMGLTSIYTYLETRMGPRAYQTGAGFFLLSRTIGASFRLYLVAIVFQFILEKAGWTPLLRCRSHCRLQPSIFTPTGEASEPWCSQIRCRPSSCWPRSD